MTAYRSTALTIEAEMNDLEAMHEYALYDSAMDCWLTYVYGLKRAHEYAAIVSAKATALGHDEIAETWRKIGAQIIKERMNA